MTTLAAFDTAAALTDEQARRLAVLLYRTTAALGARTMTGKGDTFRVSPSYVRRLHVTTDLHCAIGDRVGD